MKYYYVIVEKVDSVIGTHNPHVFTYCYNESIAFELAHDYNEKDKSVVASVAEFHTLRTLYNYAWSTARDACSKVVDALRSHDDVYGLAYEFWAVVYGAERILGKQFTEMCANMYYQKTGLPYLDF